MSKIQDAIRKLQTDRPRPSPGVPGAARQVAKVELEETGLGTEPLSLTGRRIIRFDVSLLKEQGFLVPDDQQQRVAEQYRLIKRPLLDNAAAISAHRGSGANLILVASALPGDGKTFNCINLAMSMATEKDMTVVLVDADVAKPHISSLFGLSNEPGLIDLLADEQMRLKDVVVPTAVQGLSILPAGKMNVHAPELLASQRMEAVTRALSESAPGRIVIFDSSPMLVRSEARILAKLAGQIVMIVAAGRTPQHAVLEALESMDEDKAINLVLNRAARASTGEAYGYYGYGRSSADPYKLEDVANEPQGAEQPEAVVSQ